MNQPPDILNPVQNERNFLNYLIMLAKYSRMLIYSTLGVTIVAYLYLFCSPNVYQATVRLLPPQQNLTMSGQLLDIMGGEDQPGKAGGAGGGMGSLGGAAASLLGIRSSGDYYVGLLTSNTLFDNIIDRFDLRKIYGKNYYEDARKALTKNAKITSSRKEGFIIIQVTDRIAKRAADLANAFGDELDKLLKTLAANEAKDRLAFLEKERVQASLNLSKAEEVLRTFAEQSGVVQLDTQTKGMLQYIGTLRAEVDAKEVQAQVLRQQATPFNYDVIRVEEEIKSLKEKQLAAESHLDQNCVGDVCLPTSKTPALALEYIRLYREAKFQEGLYQIFSKMVEIARLDLGKNVSLVQVLDRATPPERRFNSRLTSAMGVGFLGFLMAICLAFVREYWLNRPWTEDDTARLDHLHSALQQWRRDVQEVTGRFQRKKQ